MQLENYFVTDEQFHDLLLMVDELQEESDALVCLEYTANVVDSCGTIREIYDMVYNKNVEGFIFADGEAQNHIISISLYDVQLGYNKRYHLSNEDFQDIESLQKMLLNEINSL